LPAGGQVQRARVTTDSAPPNPRTPAAATAEPCVGAGHLPSHPGQGGGRGAGRARGRAAGHAELGAHHRPRDRGACGPPRLARTAAAAKHTQNP
jgi:hypothetical protein